MNRYWGRWVIVATLSMASVAAACNIFGLSEECTSELVYAIGLTAVDSVTNGPIVDAPGTIVATDASYADTVTFDSRARLRTVAALAEERPGTYDLDVSLAGYAPWERASVQVQSGECHVEGVEVTARLQATG